ncbi:MAG: tetratricopeptide repeat protein [Chloroflexota bacterium]
MGRELVKKLLPVLNKIEWTDNHTITQFGLQTYEMGMDWVDQYEGDSKVLQTAIKTFQSSDSLPYALAGTAYMLANLAKEKDGTHDHVSLDEAMRWLGMAQEIEPDRPQINFIEAQVYLYKGEMENARMVLDYLHAQAPYIYRLNITEAQWQEKAGNFEGMDEFYLQAEKVSTTVPQKVRIQSLMGDTYMKAGNLEKALDHYNQAIYFNREGEKLWHKMSLIYWKMGDYEECKRCNDIVLRLKPNHPSGLKVQSELKRKMGTGGLFNRLRS